jgi:hypothetical protein
MYLTSLSLIIFSISAPVAIDFSWFWDYFKLTQTDRTNDPIGKALAENMPPESLGLAGSGFRMNPIRHQRKAGLTICAPQWCAIRQY